jgi:hypothetical protein
MGQSHSGSKSSGALKLSMGRKFSLHREIDRQIAVGLITEFAGTKAYAGGVVAYVGKDLIS